MACERCVELRVAEGLGQHTRKIGLMIEQGENRGDARIYVSYLARIGAGS